MMVGKLFGIALFVALMAPIVPKATAGDGDPFPLMCADFSGNWKSDAGDRYDIAQRQCGYIRMQMSFGSQSEIMTIIPDNKTRNDRGSSVRHRWNSPDNATVLETHRVYMADANTQVTEVTMFERANEDLLLETTYRTIEVKGQPPRHDYNQTVFRKMDPSSNQTGDDLGSSGSAHGVKKKVKRHH
jgi:hypothetical protein